MNNESLLKNGLWVLALLLLTLGSAMAKEARQALVIGNSGYQRSPLGNPKNDARDLARVLKKLGFQVTLKIDADIETMESALSNYADRLKRKGGVGLFYYAGHGVQANGENFLIPVNSGIQRASQIRRKALSLSQVMEELKLAGNDLNMVVLDACRDNPFPGEFRTAKRGLARIDSSPPGAFIAYATAPGDTASDGNTGHSPFTRYLIEAIQQPGLLVEQVFKQVRNNVRAATNGKQTPWTESSLEGDFYFLPRREQVANLRLPAGRPVQEVEPPAAPSRRSFEPEMVFIRGGEFEMGCVSGKNCDDDERVHRVRVGDFWMGKYEVTVGQYKACMRAGACRAPEEGYEKYSPSDRHPIQSISWNDAVAYAEWLSGETGKHYRLPTEAEWEYAARAGSQTKYWWGNEIDCSQANYDGGKGSPCYYRKPNGQWRGTKAVGSYPANRFGLYDMNGNVWEWTCSNYDSDYGGAEKRCASNGDDGSRVNRGGSWFNYARDLRSAYRNFYSPGNRDDHLGFRLLRQP